MHFTGFALYASPIDHKDPNLQADHLLSKGWRSALGNLSDIMTGQWSIGPSSYEVISGFAPSSVTTSTTPYAVCTTALWGAGMPLGVYKICSLPCTGIVHVQIGAVITPVMCTDSVLDLSSFNNATQPARISGTLIPTTLTKA